MSRLVSLQEVMAAARARQALLTAESAGYFVVGVVDAALVSPVHLDPRTVFLSEEGTISVRSPKGVSSDTSAREARFLLGRLLAVASSSAASLVTVASRSNGSLEQLEQELEASLVPLNRAAARRALARLARETARAVETRKIRVDVDVDIEPSEPPAPVRSARAAAPAKQRVDSAPPVRREPPVQRREAASPARSVPQSAPQRSQREPLREQAPSRSYEDPRSHVADSRATAPRRSAPRTEAPRRTERVVTPTPQPYYPEESEPVDSAQNYADWSANDDFSDDDYSTPLSASENNTFSSEYYDEREPIEPTPGDHLTVPAPGVAEQILSAQPPELVVQKDPSVPIFVPEDPTRPLPQKAQPAPDGADRLIAAFETSHAVPEKELLATLKQLAGLEPPPAPAGVNVDASPNAQDNWLALSAHSPSPVRSRQPRVPRSTRDFEEPFRASGEPRRPRAPKASLVFLSVLLLAGLALTVAVWVTHPEFFTGHPALLHP